MKQRRILSEVETYKEELVHMPTTRRPKIVNAIWRLYPSTEFVEEIIGGNREMSLARAQNGHGRGKGLLRVVPSHYLQRLRSRRRLRRIAFATCCCGISKLNAARGQYRQQRSCAAGQVSILREGTEALEKRLRAVSVTRHALVARAPGRRYASSAKRRFSDSLSGQFSERV